MNKFFIIFLFILAGCQNNRERLWREKIKMGDYYLSNKNIDMALKFWIDSLNFKKDVLTYEKIIALLIIKNDLKEAKKYTTEGLTYFPNNDNLLFNLGLLQFYLEEYDESLKTLGKLMEKNKYYPNVHYISGLIYEKKGDFESAKREFIEEVNINPGSKKAWMKIKEKKNEK
ncbi:MAG: hypothetical protein NZ891_00600 [bacterium]|nr:hypothetical protein [bacterium]MDW8163231.1 hypothetical protein [Candidatus Omnitrophota bacterium]